MQAASDAFLGWARADGFDTYVRQLRDMKGSVPLDDARPDGLTLYGRLCGAALAGPMPGPASPPSSPATWDRAQPSTTAWLRSRWPTPTRTTGTTSRSWPPSGLVGSRPSQDVDRTHSLARRDRSASQEVGDEIGTEWGAVHEQQVPGTGLDVDRGAGYAGAEDAGVDGWHDRVVAPGQHQGRRGDAVEPRQAGPAGGGVRAGWRNPTASGVVTGGR